MGKYANSDTCIYVQANSKETIKLLMIKKEKKTLICFR